MYQIAICDDEKIFTDKLAHMIKQYSNAHHHVIDLHLFNRRPTSYKVLWSLTISFFLMSALVKLAGLRLPKP